MPVIIIRVKMTGTVTLGLLKSVIFTQIDPQFFLDVVKGLIRIKSH